MTPSHGRFVWYELMTTDGAAATFYGEVVGWRARAAAIRDVGSTLLSNRTRDIAGMTLAPAAARAAGARPGWSGYIAVDDVDAVVGEIVRRGGAIHREAADVSDMGRIAVVADPQGAVFVVFKTKIAPSPAPAPEIGDCAWHELIADDPDAAFAFYADLFGWTKAHAVEMEPGGLYQLFAKDGVSIGGMMARSPLMPGARWRYYFRVDGIDTAAARIVAAGGTVENGPREVPGDDWIVQGRDPQGMTFSLVSKIR